MEFVPSWLRDVKDKEISEEEEDESGSGSERVTASAHTPNIRGRKTHNVRSKKVHTRFSEARNVCVPTQGPSPHWQTLIIPKHLRSPAAARSQIRATSVSLIGPKAMPTASSTFYHMLADSWVADRGASTAFNQAFDAVSLVQLAVSFQDERFAKKAVTSYFGAMRKLRQILETANITLADVDDELLVTTYLLFVCARFAPIARAAGGSFGFDAHLQGFGHLIAAKPGPRSNVHLFLLADHHNHAVGWGMRRHKRVRFRMSERDMDIIERTSCRLPRFTKLVADLPALLEKYDRIIALQSSSKARDGQMVALLENVRQYTNRVLTWLEDWHARVRSHGQEPYTVKPAYELPSFVGDIDVLSSEVFEMAYAFPTCPSALGHIRVWVALMVCYILQVRLEVRIASTTSASSITAYLTKPPGNDQNGNPQDCDSIEHYAPAVRSMITGYADNACRALIHSLGPGEGTFHGWMIVAGAMPEILRWYRHAEEWKRVAWCDAVNDACKNKGLYV